MTNMTVEKAIEVLTFAKEHDCIGDSAVKTALDMAIAALENQVPKKVKIENWSPVKCPTCGYILSESLGDGYYKHPYYLEVCRNTDCCQRLKWD